MKLSSFLILSGLTSAWALPEYQQESGSSFVPRSSSWKKEYKFSNDGKALFTTLMTSEVCGDAKVERNNDDDAKQATYDHCSELLKGLDDIAGQWSVTNSGGGIVPNWGKIVSYGTCQFYINRGVLGQADGGVGISPKDVKKAIKAAIEKNEHWSSSVIDGKTMKFGSVLPSKGEIKCDQSFSPLKWKIQGNQPGN